MKTILIVATAKSYYQKMLNTSTLRTVYYNVCFYASIVSEPGCISLIRYIDEIDTNGFTELAEIARESFTNYYKDNGDSITFLTDININL